MDLLANNNRTLGRRDALCVGISTYTGLNNRNLRYAVADAVTVAERLADPQRGDFVVSVLKEPIETTKAALDEAVENLVNTSDRRAEDLILLYFSCHGDVNKKDNTFCLLPSNTIYQADGTLEQTTVIGISDLARWFSRARTRNIVVLLDVCHSGGAGVALQHFTLHLETDLNIFIIGAARQDRTTTENSSLEHGMFTHCLLRAFEQPPTKDGWLTISQIQNFVSDDISWFAKDQPLQIQMSSVSVNPHLPMLRNPGYPELCPVPPLWNVPFQRNMFLTGQDDLLSQLADMLQNEQKAALTQPYAINGLGGIGKTQLALEYTYRHRQDYHAILWASADSRETLIATFVNIAHLLDLSQKDETDQMVIVDAVKAWLMERSQWLFILDNADELALITEFIPPTFRGHLLLTTRVQAIGGLAHKLEVNVMSPESGALLLLRRSRLVALDAPLEAAPPSDIIIGKEIAEELGGLPLALDQAGAYIEEAQCSLSDYQQRYQTRRALLLQRRGSLMTNHPEPVATTWSLSFEKIEQQYPAATDLLRLCAFLAPDTIPEDILTESEEHLGPVLSLVVTDPVALDEAIALLGAYSLLRRNEKLLTIHRLVQAVLKDAMSEAEQRMWIERVAKAINQIFPSGEFSTWSRCQRLLSHVITIANETSEEIESSELGYVLVRTARYLSTRAQYTEAEPMYRRALSIMQKHLSPDHLDVATAINNLAILYFQQGRYVAAEPLFLQAMHIIEEHLGFDHLQIGLISQNLALLYFQQGKDMEAEPLFLQAVHIIEEHLGSDHLQMALPSQNLALLYFQQGKDMEAEPLFLQALQILKEHLGSDHLDLIFPLQNLALLYIQQGNNAEGEPLLQQALLIGEQLGPDHPDLILPLINLGTLYLQQGKDIEAEPLFQHALRVMEQLDSNRPNMALPLSSLADFYSFQDKYIEAEPLYQSSLRLMEEHLPSDHLQLARPLEGLGNMYYWQDKYGEAEPLLQRALQIREQYLGPDHFQVATTLGSLANLYREQNKYEEAMSLYQRALQIMRHYVASDHFLITSLSAGLARLYLAQRKYIEAEPLFQRVLQIREQQLDLEHPHVASALIELANLYKTQKKYALVEPLLQRALQIREQRLGSDHLQVADVLYNLANLYYQQSKYAMAEPLFQRALQIREQQLGPDHLKVASALTGLALLYEARLKFAKAKPLYQRALQIREQQLDPDHLDVASALYNLATLYRSPNKYAEAEPLLQRALQIRERQLGSEHPSTQEIRKDYERYQKAERYGYWIGLIVATLITIICLVFWFFQKFDLLSWIALVIAIVSGRVPILVGYYVLAERYKNRRLHLPPR